MTLPVALVRGVGSHNGGAELLLRAAVDHLTSRWRVVADRRKVTKTVRNEWSVGGFLEIPKLGAFRSVGWSMAPRSLARAVDNFSERHIDALFDASGFFLGDQWNSESIARDERGFNYLSKRRRPIVMLPQAFGPFNKHDVARGSRAILESADLVCVRDRISFDHVRDLMGESGRIRLVPDITIALEASSRVEKTDWVALVPNVNVPSRMHDSDARQRYVRSLATMAEELGRVGLEPVLLVHSSHGDPGIAKEVKQLIPNVREFRPRDGLHAKAVIGSCRGVIAGRYHAIVSALAQGVPAVAHSWSHKYGELLQDFGVTEGLADPFGGAESVELLSRLIDSEAYSRAVRENKPLLVKRIESMWREVDDLTARIR